MPVSSGSQIAYRGLDWPKDPSIKTLFQESRLSPTPFFSQKGKAGSAGSAAPCRRLFGKCSRCLHPSGPRWVAAFPSDSQSQSSVLLGHAHLVLPHDNRRAIAASATAPCSRSPALPTCGAAAEPRRTLRPRLTFRSRGVDDCFKLPDGCDLTWPRHGGPLTKTSQAFLAYRLSSSSVSGSPGKEVSEC